MIELKPELKAQILYKAGSHTQFCDEAVREHGAYVAGATEYATKAQKLADQLQKLNEAVQHLFDIRKEKNKKNQVLNAWNDVALNLQDSKKLLSSWNEGKDYVRLNCMGCGKDFYGPEPKMCCDGRECGCMGQPTEPVVCSQECYNKVVNRYGKEGKE